MVDITQATDADIRASVEAFSAALHARPVQIAAPTVRRILLAVDQSNQGEAAGHFAARLAVRCRARVVLLYAYEGGRDTAREQYLDARARALEDQGVTLEPLEAPVRSEHGLRSFEQILRTCETQSCDLVVVPAPYGDDYVKLGADSVGVNLDVLLSRSPVPLFVVRAPDVDPVACLQRALLPITAYSPAVAQAAGWMLGLVAADGEMRLLARVSAQEAGELGEAARDLDILEIDAEKLAGLRRPELAGLVAALQRQAAEAGLGCRLLVRAGEPLDTVEEANTEEGLLVLASSPQREAQVRTCTLVRGSRNPVLVVAGRHAAR